MSVQPRLIQTDGYAVLNGVQMVVKAGLESGADTLVGAQLDGPMPYADLLADHSPLFLDKGVHTLTLPDARQAIAALQSAWLSGRTSLGVFEAHGVIDAANVLLSTKPITDRQPGGVLLCFGDSDSSEGEAALALLRRAGWVVIEPALQDEVKTFTRKGLAISRASGRPVALALPGSLIHGAATVSCEPNTYPGGAGETKPTERASENVDPQSAVITEARAHHVNIVANPPGKDEDLPLVLITIGRSFGWARHAMAELGLAGRLPMLRMGMLTPLDDALIQRHTESCQRVLVLDPTGLGIGQAVGQRAGLDGPGASEADEEHTANTVAQVATIQLDPNAGTSGVIDALRPWLKSHETLPRELVTAGLARLTPETSSDSVSSTQSTRSTTPPPGSSLIDLSVVLGRLRRDLSDAQHMLEQHSSGPIDLSIFGELDDSATLLLTRWQALHGGQDCDGRLAGAAAAGAMVGDDTNRSVVLMTSRRFFSLGASTIADSVRSGRNAVFVIHTEDPAEAVGPRRRFRRQPKANALDMQAIVEGINVGRRDPTPSVITIDPADRPRMRRLLERLVLSDGVHVVIARRRRGPRYYRKASEVHQKQSARRGYVAKQGCLVHCPEVGPLSPRRRVELGVLGVEPTAKGPDPWTVSVSWSWHDDTVMHALAEPAVGLAILERNQPERSRVVAEDLDQLPDPPAPIHASADAWRAVLCGITGSAFDLTLELLLEAGAAMGYLVRSTAAHEATESPVPRRVDVLFTRHEPDNAPHVPAAPGRASSPMLSAQPMPGHADLFLGTELTEAARLITEDRSPLGKAHTHALIDTLVIPDVQALSTGASEDAEALLATIAQTPAEKLPIARLAEWLWGHQRYAAWVYLGYLVQRGLVPLTTAAIDAAGQRALGMTDPRSAEAVKVGRKLALDPTYADRALEHEEPDIQGLVRTLADDLAEKAGSRRGASLAGTFQATIQPLIEKTAHLDDALRRQIVTTAQRCVFWAGAKHGPAYCKRYVETLGHIIDIDPPGHDGKLTRTAADGFARAMLIPDEVYLAALLTAPQRYRRDRRRLNISLERGDKISYVHLLRPEFDLFKRRIGFTITLGERALKTLAGLYVLRRIRPGWYRTQRAFRDLYLQTLADLPDKPTDAAYRHANDIAAVTAGIVGRGDVRRDSVQAARRKLEKLIAGGEEAAP